ncbi:MAG TPA: SH3 domain-containing protein [Candidatus Dormibacteraeota bacterium]
MIGQRLLLVLSVLGVAGCSASGTTGGGTASGTSASASSTPGASATPRLVGSMRTVMTQLGLNMHADAARSTAVVGVLGQGAQVAVLDYHAADGGWFKVQGQTVTGWIVADPTLTAAGTFTSYASNGRGFSVLYPDNWTFAEEPNDTLFRPQAQGAQTIVVRTAAGLAALGPESPSGYTTSFSNQEIVCGYTGQLLEYQRQSGAASPSPVAGSAATRLAFYADIRLRFDATHAIELAMNYNAKSDLQVFADFYNSISFPYPLCQAPASPAPAPT